MFNENLGEDSLKVKIGNHDNLVSIMRAGWLVINSYGQLNNKSSHQ